MKILEAFGEPITYGGQESFVVNLVSHMDMADFKIDFLTPYYCDNDDYRNIIAGLGGSIYCLHHAFRPGKSRFNTNSSLDEFFAAHQYDCVHIHSGSISMLAIFSYYAKKHNVKKVIVHAHNSMERSTLKNTVLRYLASFFMNTRVDTYCACSRRAGKSKFVSSVLKNKLVIIKNGIDTGKFQYDVKKRNKIRERCNLAKDDFVVGHVGRFAYEKNHEFLIKIFREINQRHPRSKLLLVGSGQLEQDIKKQVEKYDLSFKVIFIGRVNNVEDYYQAMDCFVLPSKYEGLGIVGIEAQAAGLPCSFADTIPPEAVVSDRVTYVILGQNEKVWAETILKNSHHRIRNGAEQINNYSIEDTAKFVRAMYLEADH